MDERNYDIILISEYIEILRITDNMVHSQDNFTYLSKFLVKLYDLVKGPDLLTSLFSSSSSNSTSLKYTNSNKDVGGNNDNYEINLNIKHTYCCITAFLGYQLGQDGYIRTQTEHPVPKRSYFQSIMPLLKNEGDNKAIDIIKKYCHTKYSLRDWKEFLTELIESLCPCNMWMLNCLDSSSN